MNRLDGQALARCRFAAQLRDGQIFRRRTARGRPLWPGRPRLCPRRRGQRKQLGLLNIAQALIVNLLMAGAMAYTVWGWAHGRSPGDMVFVNTYLTSSSARSTCWGWSIAPSARG
jgi:ATP-binding cassette subfamily B protein